MNAPVTTTDFPAESVAQVKQPAAVLRMNGTYDTLLGEPGEEYDCIDWAGIVAMVEKPAAVKKKLAPTIIPSTYIAYDGREHHVQRERGNFVLLAVDVDKGNPSIEQVIEATQCAVGYDTEFLVYSSSSSTDASRKWRVLIPLADGLPGEEYPGIQTALFSLYADRGIQCDDALSRTGQPVYLPNVPKERRGPDGLPLFYAAFHHKGCNLELSASCAIVVRCSELYRRDREAQALALVEAQRRRGAKRAESDDDGLNPTQWFNENHSIEALLLEYGYERNRKGHWRSPQQESGTFATMISDDGEAFVSLSGSDRGAGLGAISKKSSAVFGDAFDLYCFYQHGNDHAKAWAAIRRMMPRQPSSATSRLDETLRRFTADSGKPDGEASDDQQEESGRGEDGLILNAKGNPIACLANVLTLLRSVPEWQGVMALDRMAAKVMLLAAIPDAGGRKPNAFQPRQLIDGDIVKAAEWFQRRGLIGVGKETVGDAINLVAEERGFDPLEDKLRSLVWDGVPRIENWLLDYCGAEITATQPEAYIKAVGRCWLISAAARALRPGCKVDSALVLVGRQGIGKSTAGRILAYGDWFTDNLPPVHSKDASDHLRGVWIVEFGEMATASRADVEEMKAFITRTTERFRPAYGRMEIEYPRRNVFMGTTNRDAFLKDDTGNRRFWPVEVTEIDAARLEADRDQLWAEAVKAFDSGQQWHLTAEEAELASTQAKAFVMMDERQERLAQRLKGDRVTSTLKCLELLGMKDDTAQQMQVGKMLRALGWTKRKSGGLSVWDAPEENFGDTSHPTRYPQDGQRYPQAGREDHDFG